MRKIKTNGIRNLLTSFSGYFVNHFSTITRFGLAVTIVAGLFVSVTAAQEEEKPVPLKEKERTKEGREENGEKLAFVGLHGGVFEQLKKFEKELGVRLEYLSDERIAKEEVDLASYRVVFLQHIREAARDQYKRLVTSAKKRNPKLRIFDISGGAEERLPDLVRSGLIEHDPEIRKYYGSSPENLQRLLIYVLVKYLGRTGTIEPPVEVAHQGLYHPDRDGLFDNAQEFLRWSKERGQAVEGVPRALVTAHSTHLMLQQPRVVRALIRAFEKRGVLAAGVIDLNPEYEKIVLEFKPDVVIHTCHGGASVAFREKAGIPHLHCFFFRKQSIEQWRENLTLPGLDMPGHPSLFREELIGGIEFQVGSGTLKGGGSEEAFTPITERIEHLVDRAVSWIRLGRIENKEKKVAIIYWNREMGKGELMRGTATGMFMNGPRSLVNVLKEMRKAGYEITKVPAGEDELVAWMMEMGHQIGVWVPGVLDKLARSGDAVLVPVEKYMKWFETKVPEKQRKELIKRWGEPPGKFLVWEKDGERFIVIPRIDLGNVILLPQPLRGEAHDTSLLHDRLVPPPHNYLATYFWLQEEFGADAFVHFGTHGSDFLLPGRPNGLGPEDWTDIIMGRIPNIQPWVINNLGESTPTKRRSYAVLIDHLTPPSVKAELSDELSNLHNDIHKWDTLGEGALKEKFRSSITHQVRNTRLDTDLHIALSENQLLTPDEVVKVLKYLHDIHEDTTPVNLHIFGEPPREDLLIPHLVTCLRKRFLDSLVEIIPVPGSSREDGEKEHRLREKAEEVMALVIRRGLVPVEALTAVGGKVPKDGLPKEIREDFELAMKLNKAFGRTHEEIDNLLAALDGRFILPGPGNSPDRNPAVVPTGRNMYVMNPEEVPSKPSWELGKSLVDQLLAQELESKGRYPQKVAFTLNSFATFQDYGVMESQILYLMGVRPVWDAYNLVVDVELIPAEELGRPRLDVFISALGYYRDTLPTRMRLLDKAIRLVATLEEKNNLVYENSQRVRRELESKGTAPEKAEKLSRARIFGQPPGQIGGSAGYYYLVERSGEWDNREELMNTYLEHSRHVYTEGMWGDNAPETYNRHIQGAELVLRTWADRTRSPLSNKYVWYKGGSLALAIKHLTGKEPEFVLSDVRDSDRARMVNAHDALRQDYRVRLFNRKWIEGMMKEGYAGADQVAVMVSNTMGWKIMREKSVSDDIWEEIVAIYVKDKLNLSIREWFEAENPYAFQEMTEILLETIRKGYWNADEEMKRNLAELYARSVARHGEGGGLRGGGNVKLERFIEEQLKAPGTRELEALLAQYQLKVKESSTPGKGTGLDRPEEKQKPKDTEQVRGKEMEEVEAQPRLLSSISWWVIGIVIVVLFLLILGYRLRGFPGGKSRS